MDATDHHASDAPDPGPVPTRVLVDAEQARRLVAAQLPQWADLPVEPVAEGGWDNQTFRLGADKLLRLPSAAAYADAVEKEQRWLPVLAPRLPLPIPTPLVRVGPSADFPHPWSVYRWIEGVPARRDLVADPVRFAGDLAGFLVRLQEVETRGGPSPGLHNFYRGGPLRTYDHEVRHAFEALQHLDHLAEPAPLDAARVIWAEALDARWDGVDRWFHGDVARGNLLLDDAGQLVAVLDFGTCGVGDPACDLAVAWTLLTAKGRAAFRARLGVDDASWARGRGWALWKALVTCLSLHEDAAEDRDGAFATDLAEAERVLAVLVEEHGGVPHAR